MYKKTCPKQFLIEPPTRSELVYESVWRENNRLKRVKRACLFIKIKSSGHFRVIFWPNEMLKCLASSKCMLVFTCETPRIRNTPSKVERCKQNRSFQIVWNQRGKTRRKFFVFFSCFFTKGINYIPWVIWQAFRPLLQKRKSYKGFFFGLHTLGKGKETKAKKGLRRRLGTGKRPLLDLKSRRKRKRRRNNDLERRIIWVEERKRRKSV